MTEHNNDRMKRCADAMRTAFFAEFGRPETLSPTEAGECVRTLLTLYTGQFVEGVLRFKRDDRSIEETILDATRAFIATNQEWIAELGKGNADAFLAGTAWQDLDDEEAAAVCEARGAAAEARAIAEWAGVAEDYAALSPQDRANELCAGAAKVLAVESEPIVVLTAAMQIAVGPVASAVIGLDAHKRAEHLAKLMRTIRQMVEATIAQVTPSGRPH